MILGFLAQKGVPLCHGLHRTLLPAALSYPAPFRSFVISNKIAFFYKASWASEILVIAFKGFMDESSKITLSWLYHSGDMPSVS